MLNHWFISYGYFKAKVGILLSLDFYFTDFSTLTDYCASFSKSTWKKITGDLSLQTCIVYSQQHTAEAFGAPEVSLESLQMYLLSPSCPDIKNLDVPAIGLYLNCTCLILLC